MKLPFRQGLVSYQTDSNKSMQFLIPASSGVTLYVSPTPTVISFAHGDANYLFTESVTVPDAWIGPFSSTEDSWLYWDLNLKTGARTFGHTIVAPTVSERAPAQPMPDHHWFDLGTTTMKVWRGIWVPVVRVFAAKYRAGSVLTSIAESANQLTFAGTQVGLNNRVTAGSLMFDRVGNPIKSIDGKFLTTEDAFLTGISSATKVKLGTILVEGMAEESIPSYSAVYFSDFSKIRLADAYTSGTKVIGIVEDDAYTGQVVSIITDGVVENPMWNWSTVNAPVYIRNDGTISTSPDTVSSVPIGMVTSDHSILLKVAGAKSSGTSTGGGEPVPGPRGPTGATGADGRSAYQVAVARGFVGSETQWLASLKGATGNNGRDGATGSVGPVGPIGPIGPIGLPGIAGKDGARGLDGLNGKDGVDGKPGVDGARGADGTNGKDGAPGKDGARGTDGLPGATGATGATGPAGKDGAVGPTGATGATGAAGKDGERGSDGLPGATGATGPAGKDGIRGTDGLPGPTGATGPAGKDGAIGATGATGATGPAGKDGAVGPTGATGATGPAGKDGAIGPIGATGATGPAGKDGAVGPTGAAGATGPAGKDGAVGATGPAGKDGINGIDGAPGLSAYQIAVANGFVGTEAAWLESLHGTGGGSGTDPVLIIKFPWEQP
jgi:hypothetical protein